MTKRYLSRWRLLPVLILVVVLTACGSGSSASAPAASQAAASSGGQKTTTADAIIIIKNFMFQPASLTVGPGAVVTVRNEDSVAHTVTDKTDPKLFSSGTVAPGQTKTFKAPSKPGTYPVFCTIHQFMAGTLVVR